MKLTKDDIRTIRYINNLSKRDLAKQTGLSLTYVSMLENGERPITDNVQNKILNHFKLTADDMQRMRTLNAILLKNGR